MKGDAMNPKILILTECGESAETAAAVAAVREWRGMSAEVVSKLDELPGLLGAGGLRAVLVDRGWDGGTGWERAVESIRSVSRVPVILVGREEDQVWLEALPASAVEGVLTRPFTGGELRLVVAMAGRVGEMLREGQDNLFRRRMQETQLFLARNSGTGGEEFFRALARFLAGATAADFVCIDRLQNENLEARTEAVFVDGAFEDNVVYTLKQTPCGEVVGREVCSFPSDVARLFPEDPVLVGFGAEAYVGVTLWSQDRRPIGLIALIWRQRLVHREVMEAILQLVGVRAAGEMERKMAEERLRLAEALKQGVLDSLTAHVAVLDRQGNIIAVNQPWRDFARKNSESGTKSLCEGVYYLEVLRRSIRSGDAGVESVLEGIEAVLGGRSNSFVAEYRCQTPEAERWFSMRVSPQPCGIPGVVITHEDVTERWQSDRNQELAVEFLRLANECHDRRQLIRQSLEFIKSQSDCEAAGIRLRNGEDFPYYEVRGFTSEFVEHERSLCARDRSGNLLRDAVGQPVMECTCGLLMSGKPLPAMPCFTPLGGFWTNRASEWLGLPAESDKRVRPRNHCIHAGYESVALMPLVANGERVGLLQLNDRRKGMFSGPSVALWERLAGYLAVALAKFEVEEALREKQRELTTLLGNLPGMAYRGGCDRPWDMMLISGGCEELTGYRPAELQSGGWISYRDLVHNDDRDRGWLEVRTALGESKRYQLSYRIVTRMKVVKWVWEQGTGVYSASGELVALEGFVSDVTERHRAIEALRTSEERYARVEAAVADGIWEWNLDTGECYFSKRWVDFLGCTEDELPRDLAGFLECVHPADRDLFEEAERRHIRDGDPYRVEFRLRRRDGTYRWICSRGEALRDADGRPARVVGSIHDVTETRRMEAVKESLLQLQSDLESVSTRMDVARALMSAVARLWNWDAGSVVLRTEHEGEMRVLLRVERGSKGIRELGVGAAGWKAMDRERRVLEQGVLFGAEGPAVQAEIPGGDSVGGPEGKGGEEFASLLAVPLRWRGRSEGLVTLCGRQAGVFQENDGGVFQGLADHCGAVLERLQAAEDLRRSEERFRVMFEESPTAIWEEDFSAVRVRLDELAQQGVTDLRVHLTERPGELLDLADRVRVVSKNRKSIDLLAGGDRGAVGRDLTRFFTEESLPVFREEILALAAGEVRFQSEISLVNLRREPILMDLQLSVMPGHEATWSRVLISFSDLTERRRAEQVRADLEAQLRQSQKLEAIGQLAGGVAHDFNNILAAVMMNLSLLADEAYVSQEGRLSLSEIERGAQRAASLVRQLLLFARRQVMRVQRVEVGRLLSDLYRMLSRLIGEDIRLELLRARDPVWIEADPGMIEQVVTNLVVNSRDAISGGGRILIQIGREEFDGHSAARRPKARPGAFACLSIGDTGCGMDASVMKRLFEPFFTTKEVGKGTGLGLSTIYGIVEQHRGWIEVESEVGRGSTFRVYLPSIPGEPAETTEPMSAAESMAPGRETLLMVEDEESLRVTTARLLRRLGYRVIEANDGREAMDAWGREGGRVDLLLTDLVMPGGIGGLDLAARLRERNPDLPVILVSGYSVEVLERGHGAVPGAVFMQKPTVPTKLARTIRGFLDHRGLSVGGGGDDSS
jgi:PAS domain S-box-containing protein